LYLVIEVEGMLVGCGGISIDRWPTQNCGSLVFGLIHPGYHRRGLGSTLLLARLALLPAKAWRINLQAVPASRSFYEMFGFLLYSTVKHVTGEECAALCAYLSAEDQALCRVLLERARIGLPSGNLVVPVRDVPLRSSHEA
jgi:N-acetylglutamate synthase-like GNAT family acetyltransferase